MDQRTRRKLVDGHLDAIRKLESMEVEDTPVRSWPPDQYYLAWHVIIGMMLGSVGAVVSLIANIAGAPLFGERPLQLIRVYLTFPMGERALDAEQGLVLMVGCTLYVLTGALYGIAFHLIMSLWFPEASKGKRFVVASLIGIALWIANFYLILSWLQPLLLGGNWIVRMVPVWVGLATHLAFAWTMLIGEIWGRFEPYRRWRRTA